MKIKSIEKLETLNKYNKTYFRIKAQIPLQHELQNFIEVLCQLSHVTGFYIEHDDISKITDACSETQVSELGSGSIILTFPEGEIKDNYHRKFILQIEPNTQKIFDDFIKSKYENQDNNKPSRRMKTAEEVRQDLANERNTEINKQLDEKLSNLSFSGLKLKINDDDKNG